MADRVPADGVPGVVILLANPERGCAVQQALTRKGVDSQVVANSDDLHRRLLDRNADIVVVEQSLGGFLSGVEILARAKSDLFQPNGIIVGTVSPNELDAARRLGIAPTVVPRAEPGDIVAAVVTKLSDFTQDDSPIPAAARRLVSETDVVRPWPHILTELCTYLQNESASLSSLADDVALDPRVTAELLKIVNGTTFGLAKRVMSVPEAVKLLGSRGTIAAVLSAGVHAVQSALSASVSAEIRTWYQKRSVLLASTAESVARGIVGLCPDTAHLLGLFQDLGALVLANAHPRSYASALRRVQTVSQARLEGLEGEEFGITHADVSAALLQRWEVPQWLVLMVLDHHSPEPKADRSERERQYLHVMRIAEAAANLADAPSSYRRRVLGSAMVDCGSRGVKSCKAAIAEGIARAGELCRKFSVPGPDEATVRQLVADLASAAELASPTDTEPPTLVELPSAQANPAPGTSVDVPPAVAAPVRPQRVLVIDDETAVIKLIRHQLASAKMEVVSCDNPNDAGNLCSGVDIVLCDVHLGSMNGIDVIRGLRASGFQAPVIMVSGDRSRHTVVDCIEAGVVDYLIKPFSRAILIEKLKRHLDA